MMRAKNFRPAAWVNHRCRHRCGPRAGAGCREGLHLHASPALGGAGADDMATRLTAAGRMRRRPHVFNRTRLARRQPEACRLRSPGRLQRAKHRRGGR